MCNRIRSYVFTLNNYTDDECARIQSGDYTYIVFGKEIGESGTPHLQGFVHFENAKTMSAIHKISGWKRTALKEAESPLSAIDYCKKGTQSHEEWSKDNIKGVTYGIGADIWERGEFRQGRRTELSAVYDQIKAGASVDEVAWNNPDVYERAHKSMERLEDIRLRQNRRDFMTEGIWIFGGTGCGKSRYAYTTQPKAYNYPYDGGWWDAYKNQETVIIDEFRGQILFSDMLRMVNINPNFNVRRRNREPMPFMSKLVIVTCSMEPKYVFKNLHKDDKMEQLYRRFKIYKMVEGVMELIIPTSAEEDLAEEMKLDEP